MSAAGGSQSRSATESLVLRRAADVKESARRRTAEAASRIITAALNDLEAKQGRPPLSASADHAAPTLLHVIETDGERFISNTQPEGDRPYGLGKSQRILPRT